MGHTENIPNKMRTKTLLLTAFVGALGFTAAQAQVYSVNAVGYVNKSIPAGFSIVANPLNNGENKVADVFGANPGSLTVYRFGDAGFSINSYDADFEEWDNGDDVIAPGDLSNGLLRASPFAVHKFRRKANWIPILASQ